MEKEIEPYYQKQGKDIVDLLFNNKMLDSKFTRDDFNHIEDYIAYLFQSNSESTKRCTEMLIKIGKNI